MTAISLILDCDTVAIVRAGDASTRASVIDWSPDSPDAMADAVREKVGAASSVVIVVGLGLLEIAQPDLPPMSAAARRALLWRDADRYFPLEEPVAVVCADAFAFAVPVRLLESWVRAIRTLGTVRAIVAAPQLCARLSDSGAWTLPAGTGERGVARVRNGVLTDVRRELLDGAHDASTSREVLPLADANAMGHEALGWVDAPLDAQLLDVPHADAIHRARQRRWMASGVLALASVLALAWSANRWRDGQLVALETSATQLADRAAPALQAEARRTRAQAEMALLADAERRSRGADAPLHVLARLTELLPRDAVVQRLEWNGEQWRVEGTADHAPPLVPLLDANVHFRDVRIAAASQRFLDAGRQRESFAITFRMRAAPGGARGTP